MWCENTLFQNELTAYLHMLTHHCLKNQNVKLRLSIIGLKHGPSKVYGLSQCISYNWGQGLNANDDHNMHILPSTNVIKLTMHLMMVTHYY